MKESRVAVLKVCHLAFKSVCHFILFGLFGSERDFSAPFLSSAPKPLDYLAKPSLRFQAALRMFHVYLSFCPQLTKSGWSARRKKRSMTLNSDILANGIYKQWGKSYRPQG